MSHYDIMGEILDTREQAIDALARLWVSADGANTQSEIAYAVDNARDTANELSECWDVWLTPDGAEVATHKELVDAISKIDPADFN